MTTAPQRAPGLPAPRKKRRRAGGWMPNQHGAWFMLSAPLIVGVLSTQPRWVHLPLALFWFAGYFAFFAGSQWLKSRFKPRFRTATLTYTALAGVLGLVVLALDWRLLRFTWWFLLPAGVALWAAWARRERALWAGLTTVAAAMLLTPVVHAAGGGSSPRIWLATAVLTGYFAGTVLFVKSMIRQRGEESFRWVSVGYHALATIATSLIAWWLVLPFSLFTLRAAVMPRWKLTPVQVGLPEIAFSTIVIMCALAVL